MELCLGPGKEHDVTRAEEPLAEHEPQIVIADKCYDVELVEAIRERGAVVVIPPRGNRKKTSQVRQARDTMRNLVERPVNRIEHYHRVATRSEETARNSPAFIQPASSLVTLGVTLNMTWRAG